MRWVLVLLSALALQAQIRFTRIESDNFELYTDGSAGRAMEILRQFERVRSFFRQTVNAREVDRKPRVVVLNSQKAFSLFVERRSTAAYFIGLPHRDLLVVGPAGRNPETVTHEYVHLLVRRADMRLPLWMNEGLAELYSTLQPVGDRMRVGTPLEHHVSRLRSKVMDVRQVLDAETYGSEEHTGPFYSMSWAMVHMMMLEDDLRPKWGKFQTMLEKGMPAEQALRQSYGLTAQQLEQHVQGYLRSKQVNVVMYPFKWEEMAERPAPVPASELDTALTMIDLQLSGKDVAGASRRAEELTKAYPKSAPVWEAMGAIRMMEQNQEAAREAIGRAFDNGSTHAELLAIGASLETADRARARAMLTRALAADGQNFEAGLQLASWHMQGRDYAAAYETARRIPRVAHADMARFAAVFAQAAVRSGHPEAARAMVQAFQSYAVSEKDKKVADQLARSVGEDRPEPGANSTVSGLLTEVDCRDGQVLHVATAAGERKVKVDSSKALLVGGEDVNIGCGPQKRKRKVRIGVSPEGLARKLEFLP